MIEIINALAAFGELLAGGKAAFLAVSLALNVWQALELRRVNQERVQDLKEARERSDQNHTLTREVVEVMQALSRGVERP